MGRLFLLGDLDLGFLSVICATTTNDLPKSRIEKKYVSSTILVKIVFVEEEVGAN